MSASPASFVIASCLGDATFPVNGEGFTSSLINNAENTFYKILSGFFDSAGIINKKYAILLAILIACCYNVNMKSLDLNADWSIIKGDSETIADLPYDAMNGAVRDFSCAFGALNGYIPADSVVLTKVLPKLDKVKAYLMVTGTLGYGDMYINDERVGVLNSYAPCVFEVTHFLDCSQNVLRIELYSSPAMNDKYVGLGIAGGVRLLVAESVDIQMDTLFVKTVGCGDKVYADVSVGVTNDGDEQVKLVLDCAVTNMRGKRCGKKQRKIVLRAGAEKTFNVKVRMTRAYEWTPSDPYMYNMTARIILPDGSDRTATTRFGVVTRTLNPSRGLYINRKNTKLFGAYLSHADAALGGVTPYCNEKRRFTALKALGYNAVHFVSCPTTATLDALDDVGMYAFVDIFSHLKSGKAPVDGHVFYDGCDTPYSDAVAATSVLLMRNHPCVTLYGVADNVPECYNRHDGHAEIKYFADFIKSLDDTRPVTVSSREFVPTHRELELAGVRRKIDSEAAAISVGREKDLFDILTAGAFGAVDVAGFNYLYPLYGTDKLKHDRLILGSRTDPERAFDSIDEAEKQPHVIGDFSDCGIDYPGGGKLNEIYRTDGDLDAICDEKPQGVYKRIVMGARKVAYIVVLDPETDEPVPVWNWPRHLGQPVTVKVYTSGDVAALYLDGRLIGRKLAGKVNKHIATFKTEYYPGKLEAVCFFKGTECARAQLVTANSPKTVRLTTQEKNLSLARGDVGFVHIDVCDRDGNLVPYAMRQLSVQVTGGTLVSFVNADPMLRKNSFDTCPAYGGKALAVVRPDKAESKTVVKITGDGLLAAKITFKIKE